MNVIDGVFVNDIDLAICIFPAGTIINQELKERMIEYTKFYALRLNQLANINNKIPIYTCDSIDAGMNSFSSKHKNILFMAAGVRIIDMSIIFDIREEILSNPNYMAFGHILDWKENWYELHHQFVLVNSENWKKSGKPEYGGWDEKIEELPIIERSVENFHDDYTPLWIKYTGEYKNQKHKKQGWNFFNASSRNGFEIGNWNHRIRSKRTYYYPEANGDQLLESLKTLTNCGVTNPNQVEFIKILGNISDQIWLLNSENMKIDFDEDNLYSSAAFPAAGFKFLEIFNKNKLTENGKLILFDYNPKSIQWLQTIQDSKKSPIDLIKDFVHSKSFKCLGCKVFSSTGSFTQEFIESYQRTVSYFGGEDNFNQLLERFRNSDVTFVQCDLFNSPESLCEQLTDNCLINISNIFCTDFSNAYYGLEETENRYNLFLNALPENARVVGFGPNCEKLS